MALKIFDAVAKNVVAESKIACDFVIPPSPEGKSLDRGRVHLRALGSQLVPK